MGYTVKTDFVLNNSTNTIFRTWGQAVTDAIANCGWAQCTDVEAGTQINWTTVAAPTAATSQGYNVWKMADALQSECPIYMKIEYGSDTVGGTLPTVWLTVGNTVNASGGIPSANTPRIALSGAQNTASKISYSSGDTNRWIFAWNAGGGRYHDSWYWAIERTVNNSGGLTNTGVLITLNAGGIGSGYKQVFKGGASANATAWETTLGALMPQSNTGGSWLRGVPTERTSVYPIYHTQGGAFEPHGLNVFLYHNHELTAGIPLTMSVYGAAHTYMPVGNVTFIYPASAREVSPTRSALLVRWE